MDNTIVVNKCYMCTYLQKCNVCMYRLHVFVRKSHELKYWSSIHSQANSKLIPCPLTLCQFVFTTMVLSIVYSSSHDQQSVIEWTLNSSQWPTVPATKWRQLCVLAPKWRQLRVTYPFASHSYGYRGAALILMYRMPFWDCSIPK